MAWDFDQFVEAMEIFMNLPEKTHYRMVFDSFDFTADGMMSEFDIFLVMRAMTSELFVDILFDDFTLILKLISDKQNAKVSKDWLLR